MSGGYFDYDQHRITDMAESMEQVVGNNTYNYSEATLAKIRIAIKTANQAAMMIQRVDWLLSFDDGEDSFHKRWAEEIDQKTT